MDRNTKEDPIITRVKNSTKKLEKINNEIRLLMNKLPLQNYRDIARMHYLINEQLKLMSVTTGGAVPHRLMLPFDNARHTAIYLRTKYSEAALKGKIRKGTNRQG